MAISNYYVAYGTGNDYTGATFTDGSFANATLTLTKVGAFTNASPDHWLYLDDNGSGEVTTGYYKIASKTDNDNVVLASDIRSGANDPTDVVCTQHDGTSSLPFRSLQGAFDLITRNSTDGDQVNLKAGTAQVNVTSLNLDEYGTPSEGVPLVIRGYTAVANDGGMGEIDCGGATMWASTAYTSIILKDLEIHTFGNNHGIELAGASGVLLSHCEIHKGASAPSSKYLVVLNGRTDRVMGCYIHDSGTGGVGVVNAIAINNYFYNCLGSSIILSVSECDVLGNIVHTPAGAWAITLKDRSYVVGNIVYAVSGSTGVGIMSFSSSDQQQIILNNIIVNHSGVGGVGISIAGDIWVAGYNAFYNNTTNETYSTELVVDFGNDVILAADPFTDAANGDFSLTAAAKTALRGLGWPAAYLGAHANTDGHITIGAIQYGEAEASGGANPMHGKLG